MSEKTSSTMDPKADDQMPQRDYMEDPNIVWREGKPNYTLVNRAYMEGRTKHHKEGSLEKIVENLVKTWEMEGSHKTRLQDWQTIVKDGTYFIRANNQKKFTDEEAIQAGNYTILMQNQPLYDAKNHTFDSSHALFRTAFKDGFPWELLEVFAGPPRVVFSCRHWAKWTGPYKERQPTGEVLELYGVAIVEVDDNLKIKSIDVHYDPNQILMPLEGVTAGACPFHKQ